MKKTVLLFTILFGLVTSAFSLPGFSSYIPDQSGDFVYYKDNSFVRESYIGMLMYNDSSFQIRYVAPENKTKKLSKIDISILVSINPKSDYWNMTGERVLTPITNTAEEIDILNYLHDIMYEFSARRKKISNVSPKNPNYVTDKNFMNNGLTVSQEYAQFGGNVFISFDSIIPFFNLKAIYDTKGKALLECVVIGKITSSEDKSFNNFEGFASKKFVTKLEKLNKKAKPVTVKSTKNLSVTFDENWTVDEQMDFLFTFGDESLIMMMPIEHSQNDLFYTLLTVTKDSLLSSDDMYTDLREIECLLDFKKMTSKITKITTQLNKNRFSSVTLYSKQKNSNNFDMFMLSTTFHAFNVRKSYYNKIIASFKSEN